MSARKFFTEYERQEDPGLECKDVSLTKQSFKDECDINVIMSRAVVTEPGGAPPMFGDFSDENDFHAAMNIIAEARQQFEALPSKVRERFANDPARMLEFVNNEKNLAEAIELGICVKREEPAAPVPVKVEVVNAGVPGAEPPAAGKK